VGRAKRSEHPPLNVPLTAEDSAPFSEAPPPIPNHTEALATDLPSDEPTRKRDSDAGPPVPTLDSYAELLGSASTATGPDPKGAPTAQDNQVPPAPAAPLDDPEPDPPTIALPSPVTRTSAPPSIPSAAALSGAPPLAARILEANTQALKGDVIASRYRVDAVLGEGGMGIVYRCTDLTANESVALKRVVVPDTEHAEEYVMWFYKEARALAALDHSCIVRARDFGRLKDGSPFLVMDIAKGTSLHDLAHAGLNWQNIYYITDQILSALAHAHARGIVHGDLKPSNVLVEERDGQPPLVHVLDFGLAWLKADTHDERLDGEKAPEFKPHAGAGTPGYMAPEQIQHEQHHVCGATDLYALGCILYRLIGRTPPFTGNAKELLRKHAYSEVPRLVPVFEAPPGLVDFVMRLLEKRPWSRYEFAAEARRDFAAFAPKNVTRDGFILPKIRSAPVRPLPEGQGRPGRNPNLDAETERTTSLISIRQSPLVGREDIRAQLRAICDEVIQSPEPMQRLVLLVGPAGAGKSRIAEWLCQTVHEEGTMVPLMARYRPLRGPLDGVVGAVTRYYNFERAERAAIERSLLQRWNIKKADREGRTWVAGAAEWFRPNSQGPDAPIGPSGVRFAIDSVATRRTVSRHVVRRVGQGRKLLFWLDDLHNASDSTFEGFQRMFIEDRDQPYMIVGTVRAEDVHLGTPSAERLKKLVELMGGVAIDVPPLEPETTRELLRRSLPLEEDAIEEAAKRSRGNPLFALQQLHAWALDGKMVQKDGVYSVPPDALAVRPKTTAELWKARLDAVPERYRLAAYAIAAISSDLRREVLRPLLEDLGLAADECIFALQRAEVLIPRGPGRYSWPHALLQEYLSAELAQRPDRTRIYRAAADALKQHPLANSRRVVRQQVMNLIQGGDPNSAAALLFDFLHASWNGAREPLSTLSDLDLLRGRLHGEMRAHQDRWRSEALRHVGRTTEARDYAERARATFRELSLPIDEAHAMRLLGHIFAELGNLSEGKKLAEAALETFKGVGDILGQAQAESVLGEIDYLLGDPESARAYVLSSEQHFAESDQPLGRGLCLLLSSWIEHSEGAVDKSRRMALRARSEFERIGYRLGTAQADASLAHVEHRLQNFHSATRGAEEALAAFESLRTPRGQAACRRLLAMIAIDTDEADEAERHVEWAAKIYSDMGDPWGVVESKVLEAQVALLRRDFELAESKLAEASTLVVEEPEPYQHRLLTEAWCLRERGAPDLGSARIREAMHRFPNRRQIGDHTLHLLARLSRYRWPESTVTLIAEWRAELVQLARLTAADERSP
jgi:serine/threonine protein kinase/tetratricopeptide (TPR) repeat protein